MSKLNYSADYRRLVFDIRIEIIKKNIPVVGLAVHLGINRATLSRYLTYKSPIPLHHYMKIKEYLQRHT